ncbi:hypothetical protein [Agromyces larvae]|uniref:Uncharacterized protein n=1 Tax=Agromyces larvae TaxID=2929802 RepID=A0ABY4C3A9_9MICO|nr:hypothetical protein [Agromyces larvae]UOE45957.1 hypothetical protein MTO99_09510 [Agromyces larvae]
MVENIIGIIVLLLGAAAWAYLLISWISGFTDGTIDEEFGGHRNDHHVGLAYWFYRLGRTHEARKRDIRAAREAARR